MYKLVVVTILMGVFLSGCVSRIDIKRLENEGSIFTSYCYHGSDEDYHFIEIRDPLIGSKLYKIKRGELKISNIRRRSEDGKCEAFYTITDGELINEKNLDMRATTE